MPTLASQRSRYGVPRHGFLSGSSFASYHAPLEPARSLGCIVCPPLGYEAIQCYNTLRALAQEMSAAGFHVLRVDYQGTGESLGTDWDSGRLRAWLGSIRSAVAALEALDPVESVALVGLRMGATLAALLSSEVELGALVLWEPCASGALYTREMQILASAAASDTLGMRAQNGERRSRDEGGIQAAGYVLTPETVSSLQELRLQDLKPLGSPPVLVLSRDDRPPPASVTAGLEGAGCTVSAVRHAGFREMMVAPARSQVPVEAVEAIVGWLSAHSSRARAAGRDGVRLSREAIDGGLRRRPVRFGPSGRLFGVVTEPQDLHSSGRPPVLVLAGGVVPRTAVNRMYVSLAERLADLGHVVLRMDVSGIGESLPTPGSGWGDPYASGVLGDVDAAIEWLGRTSGAVGVELLGLCSGAYAAFQAALRHEEVRTAVLINPIAFYDPEVAPPDSPTVHDLIAARRYRRSMFSAGSWRKLLAGKIDARRVIPAIATGARSWFARWEPLHSGGSRRLSDDLARLIERGTRVSFAFSLGDPGYDALRELSGRRLGGLRRRGLVLRTFRGADHTFSPLGVRAKLLDWVVSELSPRGPGAA